MSKKVDLENNKSKKMMLRKVWIFVWSKIQIKKWKVELTNNFKLCVFRRKVKELFVSHMIRKNQFRMLYPSFFLT